jgi:CheY-like chemotaxis protein
MSVRILVIEDNATNLELMRYLLDAFGHKVTTSSNGKDGIELARRILPDLIVCDVQMPGVDGFQVARALKEVPSLARIPLIAVTALAMVDDRGKVLEGGFHGYIAKPINPETFVQQIESFLRTRADEPLETPTFAVRAQQPEPGTEKSDARAPSLGPCILVVDNSHQNLEFADSLLGSIGYRVVLARDMASGLSAAKTWVPDLIISDVHMPNADGFEFIKAVKKDERLRNVPFVFLSSSIEPDQEVSRGMACGADDFVCRPIEPQKLIEAISACLRRAER